MRKGNRLRKNVGMMEVAGSALQRNEHRFSGSTNFSEADLLVHKALYGGGDGLTFREKTCQHLSLLQQSHTPVQTLCTQVTWQSRVNPLKKGHTGCISAPYSEVSLTQRSFSIYWAEQSVLYRGNTIGCCSPFERVLLQMTQSQSAKYVQYMQ